MQINRRSRVICTLAAAAAVVALPGCGSSGNSQADKTKKYKSDASKVANDFKTQAQAASQEVQQAPDKNGKVKGLEALKGSVNTAASGFEKLDPPDKSKSTNTELVSELRSLAGDVDTVEQALKTGDASKAKSAIPKLQSDQGKIQGSIQQLQSQIGK